MKLNWLIKLFTSNRWWLFDPNLGRAFIMVENLFKYSYKHYKFESNSVWLSVTLWRLKCSTNLHLLFDATLRLNHREFCKYMQLLIFTNISESYIKHKKKPHHNRSICLRNTMLHMYIHVIVIIPLSLLSS